jgi:hypothetical protein
MDPTTNDISVANKKEKNLTTTFNQYLTSSRFFAIQRLCRKKTNTGTLSIFRRVKQEHSGGDITTISEY